MYNLEDAYPTMVLILEATAHRWRQFEQLDERLGCNSRWLRTTSSALYATPCTEKSSSLSSNNSDKDEYHTSRRRGRDYVEARIFTKLLAKEAEGIYNFDCQPVPYFCHIPYRHNMLDNETGRRRKEESARPGTPSTIISPCWEQGWSSWTDDDHDDNVTSDGTADVFLNLTVRDGSGRSWSGYRSVRSISPSEVDLSLDIIPLIDELRWTELRRYHTRIAQMRRGMVQNHHHNGRYDDHQLAAKGLENIARNLQVTITRLVGTYDDLHERSIKYNILRKRRRLLCATGGFYRMRLGNPFLDCSAYFHDRSPRQPLSTSISGGPFTTCMTITTDDRLVIKLTRVSIKD